MTDKKEKEEDSLNLSRQSKLVPIDKVNEYTIKVYGIGSVGSHVTKILAKSGFKHIEVYDMDTVDEENIAAQAFDFKHIGMNKVDAMKDICKDGAGIDIKAFNGAITPETEMEVEPNTIYCCFFDSFDARKMLYDKIKDYPTIFVDARIGQYNMRHYLIDTGCQQTNEDFGKTLEPGAVSELICGEKATAPVNAEISGKIVMNIINYISGRDYTKTFIGNASATARAINVIVSKPEEVVVKTEGDIHDIHM